MCMYALGSTHTPEWYSAAYSTTSTIRNSARSPVWFRSLYARPSVRPCVQVLTVLFSSKEEQEEEEEEQPLARARALGIAMHGLVFYYYL